MTRLRALLANPILLLAASGLYPAVFLAGQNWFAFTARQLAVLLGGSVAGAVVLGLLIQGVAAVLLAVPALAAPVRGVGGPARAKRMLASALSLGLVGALLHATLFAGEGRGLALAVSLGAGVAVVALWLARTSLAPQTSLLLGLAGLAAGNWAWSYAQLSPTEVAADSWYAAHRQTNEQIRFTRKPNVYSLVLESYQSPRALQEIYQFGVDDFIAQLEDRGFEVAPQHFSNYSDTLQSLSSILSMEHHHCRFAAGWLDSVGTRELIGGKAYNAVLDVFTRNGYQTQYILKSDYPFIRGDTLGYAFPERTLLRVFRIYQLEALDRQLAELDVSYDIDEETIFGARTFMKVARQRLEIAANSDSPYFTLIKPQWTNHSVGTTWDQPGNFPRQYQLEIERANPRFLSLVDLIIERDPTAVIMLFGDHGGWRFRDAWRGRDDLNDLIGERGVPGRTLALDLFGVFFSIRGAQGPCFDRMRSTVNMFRCLFADLAEDASLLSTLASSEAFLNRPQDVYMGVQNGEPLARWLRLDPAPSPGRGE